MDLWIRNQNRKILTKLKDLELVWEEDTDCTYIYNSVNSVESFLLGEYKTKERALEVLDEIQDKICGNQAFIIATNSGINPNNITGYTYCGVYEMPKA